MLLDRSAALLVLDARGRVRRTTPGAAALLGLAAADLIGRPWAELTLPGGLGVREQRVPMQGRRREGGLHFVHLVPAAAPVMDAATQLGAWADSAELAVLRSAEGTILEVNHAFARKFGHATTAWQGRACADWIHPDDLAGWRDEVARALCAPFRGRHEHRWRTAQGWRWLEWEEHAVRDALGAPAAWRSIGRDVTKRRLAEEHFCKLASIVEQSPLSVILTMPDGRVEYVNPRYTQVTGWTLEDIFESQLDVLRAGFDLVADYTSFLAHVRAGREWRGELRSRARSGAELWEEVQVSAIRDHLDRITHLLCLRSDITGQKRLEEQLRQSQKMECVGTMAGGIAHDFNNLLAIINGFCELSGTLPDLSPKLARNLGEIHDAGRRAAGLVRQILTFSRKQEVARQSLDLNQLIQELVRLFQETFPRNVSLEFKPGELPLLAADPNQLQQVVMNFCVNARDAMTDGGAIQLRTTRVGGECVTPPVGTPRAAAYACLEVADQGAGMSAEVKARIFEPFFTTKTRTGGTGLGLAVVYGIVAGHGGALEVDSTPGEGTRMRVYLPLDAEPTERAAMPPNASGGIPAGDETILIVEDEPGLRRLLAESLGHAGYRVIAAADGAEAMEVVFGHAAPIHAVLLDLDLPRIDGVQVRNFLGRARPEARVLVLSGQIRPEQRAQLEQLGRQLVVPKPFDLSVLGQHLRSELDLARAASTKAEPV
jgi:two-component system, cell cycle sensor histidine kinase and response regulator CckA